MFTFICQSHQKEQILEYKQIDNISNCLKTLYVVDLPTFIYYIFSPRSSVLTFIPEGLNFKNPLIHQVL